MSHKIINVLRVEHFKSKKGKAFAKCQIVLYKQDEETKDLVPCGYGFVYVFNEKLLKKIAVGKYCAVFDVFMNYQATLDCQLVDLLDENTFLSSKNTLPRKELQILSIEENETSTGKTFLSAGLVYLPNDPANVSAGTFTMFDDKDGNNILRDLKPGIYYADFDMRVASYGDNKGMLEPFISNILECKSATNNNNANTSAPKNTNGVLFINTLFREDPGLFQSTITSLNGMRSIEDAVAWLVERFPEWNLGSEVVYRFMMAARRKLK